MWRGTSTNARGSGDRTIASPTFREHPDDRPRVVLRGRRRQLPRRGGGHSADGLGPRRGPRARTALTASGVRRAGGGGGLRDLLLHGPGVRRPPRARRPGPDGRVAGERTPAGPRL